jgi:enoyl-CoA hydratase/carnithine racemase
MPEVTIGLLAGGGGAVRLPTAIPLKAAMKLLLTGKPVDAAEAMLLGLVNSVVEPGEVYPAALEFAGQIRDAAPRAVAATLKLAKLAASVTDEATTWAANDELLATLFAGEDVAEGLRAFAEKRRPRWTPGS